MLNVKNNKKDVEETMKKQVIMILCGMLVAATANAYLITDIVSEGTFGNGSNTGLLVVDFWPTGDASTSFAFVVNFDGIINGVELMDMVVNHSNGNFSYDAPGGFLKEVLYVKDVGGVSLTYHGVGDWDELGTWWSQWNSKNFGQTWGFGNGAGDDMYGDSDTLGWLLLPSTDWTSTPVTPVPEPLTGLLLAVGAVLAGRKRKV